MDRYAIKIWDFELQWAGRQGVNWEEREGPSGTDQRTQVMLGATIRHHQVVVAA